MEKKICGNKLDKMLLCKLKNGIANRVVYSFLGLTKNDNLLKKRLISSNSTHVEKAVESVDNSL